MTEKRKKQICATAAAGTLALAVGLFLAPTGLMENVNNIGVDRYVRVPSGEMDKGQADHVEAIANAFLKEGYGVVIGVQAQRDESPETITTSPYSCPRA